MGQPVVHWELWSENPEETAAFYREVFGWEIQSVPELDYHLVNPAGEGGIGGGIMKPQKGPWPGKMTFYIDVDDLVEFLGKVEAAGGKTVVPHADVPGVGALALFEDPEGRVIGLWKQITK